MGKVVDFKLKQFIPKDERGNETDPLTWFVKEPDFGMQKIQLPKQKFKLSELKKMRKKGKDKAKKVADDMMIDFDFFHQQSQTLAYCLRDVANLTDSDGNVVVVPKTIEERLDFVNALPHEWMLELYHFIITGEDLIDDDEEEGEESEGDPKNE